MAAIKNVKYLNKECIYQYFHNPNEAFLEGFISVTVQGKS